MAARAVCIDGIPRAIRFANGGQPDTVFSIPGSVRIRGQWFRGFVSVSSELDGPRTLRFAFCSDVRAERSPRYDSPWRIVGPAPTDPAGFVVESVEVEIIGGKLVPSEHSRLWVDTAAAVAEGIDPAAD
jgi:hypothetical protein